MLTNNNNLPMSVAIFLAHDDYPIHREGVISVTTLIKPLKQIIMSNRAKSNVTKDEDISSRIASSYGTALHNGIESAWKSKNLPRTLEKLGYPEGLIKKVVVNPTPEQQEEDILAVYTELRTEKEVNNWIVSGELDFCIDGTLTDYKSTGTYTYINGSSDEKFMLQGSLYRWLNPDKVTEDVMSIVYIFTDWSALQARIQRDAYPAFRIAEKNYVMLSEKEAETYVVNKLKDIDKYSLLPEGEIPECTNEELWVEPSKFKYYKNPQNTKRATRVYDSHREALQHLNKDNNVGVVMEVKGSVKACRYCDGLSSCEQANRYINSGELVL